jgi:hypothetical protein
MRGFCHPTDGGGIDAEGARDLGVGLAVAQSTQRLATLVFGELPRTTEAHAAILGALASRAGARLLTRNGYDWTGRFPRIAAAAETLRARSFLIDGEAVACDGDGLPVFDRLRYRRQDGRVFLFAFDLLELNGRDMRREPLEVRKSAELNICSVATCWGLRRITHPAKMVSGVTFYPGLDAGALPCRLPEPSTAGSATSRACCVIEQSRSCQRAV